MLIRTKKVRKFLICFSLIPLYLLWVSSAMGFPLLSMAKGNAHETTFFYSHGAFHLYINHDKESSVHESLLIDASYFDRQHQNHSSDHDHEVHVTPLVQHRAVVTTTTTFYTPPSLVRIIGAIPAFFNPPLKKFLDSSFYQINSNPFHLHKIVLLV